MFYSGVMARGGHGTGSGLPLSERRRVGKNPEDAVAQVPDRDPEPASRDARVPTRPGQHCWVSLPVDGPTPCPGLLVEWRQADRGRWEGRVVYVATLRPGRWSLVEEWIPAELLTRD